MERRTVWWRAAAAVGAAVCVMAALSGRAAAAGTPHPYVFPEDAATVEGAPSTTGAVRLAPGKTYRSPIRADGKLYYRLELDNTANAYVSATAVPSLGAAVASSEGVRVSVQDADGHRCSSETSHIGPARGPHPVTASASREIGSDPYMCQEAGTYYVLVERVGTVGSSPGSPGPQVTRGTQGAQEGLAPVDDGEEWAMELGYVLEPRLKEDGARSSPEVWASAPPEGLTGLARRRIGGTSFTTASAVAQGVWEDAAGIRAGQTLYFKVPVDWGQRLYVTAELGSSTSDDDGSVGTALSMSLYNPVRGSVDGVRSRYDGRRQSVALDPLPPVRYENRWVVDDEASGMRFAGWYYVSVHLGAPVADRFGDGPLNLTLRVRVAGSAVEGPEYEGTAEPRGVFEVTAEDREAAASEAVGGGEGSASAGGSGGTAGAGGSEVSAGAQGFGADDTAMKLVAVGGIGTGSVLVLVLGVWTVVARRAAGAMASEQGTAEQGTAVREYGA